jgi:hypothetical protein
MIDNNPGAGGATTGAMSADMVADLQKALTAGYGTDMNTLTGGASLRIQSLDPVMQATIQENAHFKLFNRLAKTKPTATVDEWTEQSAIGGFLGGSFNGETGVIQSATGTYNRRTGMVKYLMTRREVSVVQTFQNAIADSEALEYANGALQLLSDAEFALFEGNSTVVPTEFDGIKAQMLAGVATGQVDAGNIIDLRGAALNSMHPLNQASAVARSMNNFGTVTDVFWPISVQQDMDNSLDPAFRVPLSNVGDPGIKLGAPVVGIRTSGGNIATQEDIFIPDGALRQPFDVRYPLVAVANAGIKPTVGAPAAANDASSQFTAPQAGNYYYAVAGINAAGQSGVAVSAQVAVAAGQKVSIVITRSAGAQETGYVVYRSRQNGPAVIAGTFGGQGSDFREVARIGVTGATTTFVDFNDTIPGTTEAYVLNLSPGATAITWRQFLPMFKFPLAAVNSLVIPWAQILSGYLRITKRRHHVMIRNILPATSVWKPFA